MPDQAEANIQEEAPVQAPPVIENPEEVEESKEPVAQGSPSSQPEESKQPITATSMVNPRPGNKSVVRNFNVNNLETFQKYKILGAPA